jgi:hypothetical protein
VFNGWAPQYGSQLDFLTCPIYEVLYTGTRGPGKTDAILMDFAQHCGKGFGPHWRGILFRQTYPQLADIVAKSKRWFPLLWPDIKWNGGDHVWTWPDGEQLLLRHMARPDDYWNYHGHEYPWIGFEELTNWSSQDCYDSMKACSRSAFPGMPRKYRATCNPYGVGHNWVKAWFRIGEVNPGTVIRDRNAKGKAMPPRTYLRGTVYENKALMRADPEYVTKLEAISNENKRKAWLLGDWNIVAGGMFDDVWDESRHVIKPFPIPGNWWIDRAFDWGSSKPFSVGWWAEANGEDAVGYDGRTLSFQPGSLIRIGEWYGWNGKPNEGLRMLAPNIARGILEREQIMGIAGRVNAGAADSAIFTADEGTSIADTMAMAGVRWEPSQKGQGSRKHGWEKLRELLEGAVYREGPGLYVFDTCAQFRRTVPVLPRSEKDPDDVDTNAEDHIGDEARYRALHIRQVVEQEDLY